MSTDDISVSVLTVNGDQCSSFLALPLQVLDKEYYIVNMHPNSPDNKAYAIITSYEDENEITATWAGKTGAVTNYCGTAGTITGTSTFNVDVQDPCVITADGHMTGTKLAGTKTFSVVMGTYNSKYDGADPPVNGIADDSAVMAVKASAWGKRFALPRVPDGTAAGYDIVVYSTVANSKFRFVTTDDTGLVSSTSITMAGNTNTQAVQINKYAYIDADEQVQSN